MVLISYAVPFFLLAIVVELVWGICHHRNTYRLNDAVSSLMLGTLSQARKFIVLGVGSWIYHRITLYSGVPLWEADAWVTWVVAFVLYDICYYWLHRLGHERQILWAAHVAHHQSEDYNLSTALRQTSTGFLLGWVFYIPMYLLGIPAEVVVTVGALNLVYQFWVHTQHVPELGILEYLLVTPSNHRVHHAQNDVYLDRNYGGVFILWDRLFGTYQRELPDERCIYGIRGPIRSWNPLVALTHIYRDMLTDMWRTNSWRDCVRVLVARTGWQPADVEVRWPRHKSDLTHFEQYDPSVSPVRKVYGGVQLIGSTALLAFGQFGQLSTEGYWLWWLGLVWTGVVTAWWLGGRATQACVWLDSFRLAMLAYCLTVLDLSGGWFGAGLLWLIVSICLLILEAIGDSSPQTTAS